MLSGWCPVAGMSSGGHRPASGRSPGVTLPCGACITLPCITPTTTMYHMLYHYHHTTIYHLTLLSHYHVLHVPSHYPVLHVLHCQNHYHVLHLTLPSHYQNHHNALHIMASHSHHHPLHTAHQIHITLSASTSTKRDRQSVHSTKSLHVFKCSLRTTLHRRSLHKAQCAAQSLSDTAMAWS